MVIKMKAKETDGGVLLTGINYFDLDQTLDCGQCFRFDKLPDGAWHGVAGRHPLTLGKSGEEILLHGISLEEYEAFWRGYFDIDRDYEAIRRSYLTHPALSQCAMYAPGIRILRQDAWEALISFIISQNNNIKRIKGIIARLCGLFGDQIEDSVDFAFPEPQRLAALEESDLAPLRAGWRAGYILDAARKTANGEIDLARIAEMPLDDARTALRTICGVGPKVADCVLLYGMSRTDAFPLDVWMKRAMATLFDGGNAADFGEHPGIAQQYIFHFARMHPEKLFA